MLEAKSYRREQRGEAPLDIEGEIERLLEPGGEPGRAASTQELREEVRQLVIARNERRMRQGKEPLDVEEEIERQLARFGEPAGSRGPGAGREIGVDERRTPRPAPGRAIERTVEVEELLVQPGTYFNPQTEVVVVVDDSASLDQEVFNMEAYEGADWVRIADAVPIDEDQRDQLLEALPDPLPPRLHRLGLRDRARAGRRRAGRGRGRPGSRPRGLTA